MATRGAHRMKLSMINLQRRLFRPAKPDVHDKTTRRLRVRALIFYMLNRDNQELPRLFGAPGCNFLFTSTLPAMPANDFDFARAVC